MSLVLPAGQCHAYGAGRPPEPAPLSPLHPSAGACAAEAVTPSSPPGSLSSTDKADQKMVDIAEQLGLSWAGESAPDGSEDAQHSSESGPLGGLGTGRRVERICFWLSRELGPDAAGAHAARPSSSGRLASPPRARNCERSAALRRAFLQRGVRSHARARIPGSYVLLLLRGPSTVAAVTHPAAEPVLLLRKRHCPSPCSCSLCCVQLRVTRGIPCWVWLMPSRQPWPF